MVKSKWRGVRHRKDRRMLPCVSRHPRRPATIQHRPPPRNGDHRIHKLCSSRRRCAAHQHLQIGHGARLADPVQMLHFGSSARIYIIFLRKASRLYKVPGSDPTHLYRLKRHAKASRHAAWLSKPTFNNVLAELRCLARTHWPLRRAAAFVLFLSPPSFSFQVLN